MNDVQQSLRALSKVLENIANNIDSETDLGDTVDKVANITEVALDELYYMASCAEGLEELDNDDQ